MALPEHRTEIRGKVRESVYSNSTIRSVFNTATAKRRRDIVCLKVVPDFLSPLLPHMSHTHHQLIKHQVSLHPSSHHTLLPLPIFAHIPLLPPNPPAHQFSPHPNSLFILSAKVQCMAHIQSLYAIQSTPHASLL
jgi:hypothetical protein